MGLAGWQPDPYRRYELRYWNGTMWTADVSSGGLQGTDPVAEQRPKPAAAMTPEERAGARSADERQKASSGRRRAAMVVAVVVAVVLGLAVIGRGGGSSAGTSGARACLDALAAGQEYVAGTRSVDSTLTALSRAETQERSASLAAGGKYDSVVTDIVALRREIVGGTAAESLASLDSACGSTRRAAP